MQNSLEEKLVCITDGKLGQVILDRYWWTQLEVVGWKLLSFNGRSEAEFYTLQLRHGSWSRLTTVSGTMRDDILVAIGQQQQQDEKRT